MILLTKTNGQPLLLRKKDIVRVEHDPNDDTRQVFWEEGSEIKDVWVEDRWEYIYEEANTRE